MGKNNKSIQILRGSSTKIDENKSSILPGQPVYDKTNNYLYVGQDDSTNNLNNPVITNKLKGKLNTNRTFEIGPSNDHITIYSKDDSSNTEGTFNIYTDKPEELTELKKVHRQNAFTNDTNGDKTVAVNLKGSALGVAPTQIKSIVMLTPIDPNADPQHPSRYPASEYYQWVDKDNNRVFDIFDNRQTYITDPIFTPRLNLANQSPSINFIDADDSDSTEWVNPAATLNYGATGTQGYLSFYPTYDPSHLIQFSVGNNGTSVEVHSKSSGNNNIALITKENDPPKLQFNHGNSIGNITYSENKFNFDKALNTEHYLYSKGVVSSDNSSGYGEVKVEILTLGRIHPQILFSREDDLSNISSSGGLYLDDNNKIVFTTSSIQVNGGDGGTITYSDTDNLFQFDTGLAITGNAFYMKSDNSNAGLINYTASSTAPTYYLKGKKDNGYQPADLVCGSIFCTYEIETALLKSSGDITSGGTVLGHSLRVDGGTGHDWFVLGQDNGDDKFYLWYKHTNSSGVEAGGDIIISKQHYNDSSEVSYPATFYGIATRADTILQTEADSYNGYYKVLCTTMDAGGYAGVLKSTQIAMSPKTGDFKATSFTATSDKRLKENLTPYTPSKSILDLPVYKFDFKEGAKNQIGCLAQDLQEICPEIVNEDDKGYLGIQESKIIYLLLDEVKKLKEKVERLEK